MQGNDGKQLLKNKTPFISILILFKLYIEFCHSNTVVCLTGTYFQKVHRGPGQR